MARCDVGSSHLATTGTFNLQASPSGPGLLVEVYAQRPIRTALSCRHGGYPNNTRLTWLWTTKIRSDNVGVGKIRRQSLRERLWNAFDRERRLCVREGLPRGSDATNAPCRCRGANRYPIPPPLGITSRPVWATPVRRDTCLDVTWACLVISRVAQQVNLAHWISW